MDIWTAVYREQEHSRSCSLDTAIHNDWTIWNVLSCKKQTHTHTPTEVLRKLFVLRNIQYAYIFIETIQAPGV